MERPTVRRKYTRKEIVRLVYQHFVSDEQPRCTRDNGGSCIYGKTGCAVGCLFTEQDASTLDGMGALSVSGVRDRYPDIYNAYFEDSDLAILSALQSAHDRGSKTQTDDAFKEVMSVACSTLNKAFDLGLGL